MLLFLGAPLALAASPLAKPWLFYAGLLLLIAALTIPLHAGQTLGAKLKSVLRYLPGRGWLRQGEDR